MPTYDYRCPNGHEFELFQRMSAEPGAECPDCGEAAERLLSGGAGILFKGDGFYITDYRSDDYRARAKAEKEGAAKAPGGSDGSGSESGAGKGSGSATGKASESGSGGSKGSSSEGAGGTSRGGTSGGGTSGGGSSPGGGKASDP